jgi:hypothetical protein
MAGIDRQLQQMRSALQQELNAANEAHSARLKAIGERHAAMAIQAIRAAGYKPAVTPTKTKVVNEGSQGRVEFSAGGFLAIKPGSITDRLSFAGD